LIDWFILFAKHGHNANLQIGLQQNTERQRKLLLHSSQKNKPKQTNKL